MIGSALWCYFITQLTRVLIYPAAVLLGFGLSAMFVTSLSFAAELVGDNKVSVLVEKYPQSLLFHIPCLIQVTIILFHVPNTTIN